MQRCTGYQKERVYFNGVTHDRFEASAEYGIDGKCLDRSKAMTLPTN